LLLAPGRSAGETSRLPVLWQVSAGVDSSAVRRCRVALAAGRQHLLATCWPYARPPLTVTVSLVTTDTFRRWTAGMLPDWGIGLAAGGRRIVIDAWRSDRLDRPLGEVLLHELAHTLMAQATGPASLPRWFHEGVAQYVSGEWRLRDTISLMLEGVPDLDDLERGFAGPFPAADRAYRAALLAIRFLVARHGQDVLPQLLLATRRTGDFAAAFAQVTGESLPQFAAAFHRHHRLRFGWLLLLTRWPGLFVLMAVVLLVGLAGRRWRDRRRLRQMEQEEDGRADSLLWRAPPDDGDKPPLAH